MGSMKWAHARSHIHNELIGDRANAVTVCYFKNAIYKHHVLHRTSVTEVDHEIITTGWFSGSVVGALDHFSPPHVQLLESLLQESGMIDRLLHIHLLAWDGLCKSFRMS